MGEAIKKILILIGTQALPIGLVAVWKEAAARRPILAGLLLLGYEVAVLVTAFGKKVWAKIEDKAVQRTADWVLNAASGIAPRFRRRYKHNITNDHGSFNVRGLGLINTFNLELERVFVELRIAPSANPQRASSDPIAMREIAGNRPVWDFLRSNARSEATALAVIGPPGCGKTTLLQHVALVLAGNRQGRYRSRAYVPLLLFLRDHTTAITGAQPPRLGPLAHDHLSARYPGLKAPQGWFEKQLNRGNCVVLLDGLDEVAESEQRKAVSAWVDRQIRDYPKSRFVMTARPRGYLGAPLERAHVLEVQPFNREQVVRFVKSWYLANEIRSSGNKLDTAVRQKANSEAGDLVRRLRASPSLGALTVNPLLLTMIAMVHRYHGALPGSRVELYAEICEVLLGRWRQAKGIRDSLTAAQKLVVLKALAARMMEDKLRDIGTEEAKAAIEEPLARVGMEVGLVETFLSDLQAGAGLLLEREAGRWSFAHLTFQEYLAAAQWLEDRQPSRNWDEVVRDSWWHEMLRLYAAQGDATAVVQACLAVGTVQALTLATECAEEARQLDRGLRQSVRDVVVAGLESPDPERRRLAAEVQLSRRLKTLQRIDEEREIDLKYLTCAEYQLFLDELSMRGKYYRPEHWEGESFPAGQAGGPVTGMSFEAARSFCEWLTERDTQNYRLPTPEEAVECEGDQLELTTWCSAWQRPSLVGLREGIRRGVTSRLADDSIHLTPIDREIVHTTSLNLDPDLATAVSELALGVSRAMILLVAIARNRAFAFTSPDLASAHTLAHDLARDPAFNRDLTVRDSNTESITASSRRVGSNKGDALALDLALERALQQGDLAKAGSQPSSDTLGHLATAHGYASKLAQALSLELVGAVYPDFSRILFALARRQKPALELDIAYARDFTSEFDVNGIVDAFNDRDYSRAEPLLRTLSPKSESHLLAVMLQSGDALAIARAKTPAAILRAWLKYTARTLEQIYGEMDSCQVRPPDSPGWQTLAQACRDLISDSLEGPGSILRVSWRVRMLSARAEGDLPAWEAIRIVREQASPDDATV